MASRYTINLLKYYIQYNVVKGCYTKDIMINTQDIAAPETSITEIQGSHLGEAAKRTELNVPCSAYLYFSRIEVLWRTMLIDATNPGADIKNH